MTDIKQTLATALHDEPPMTLDKAGIVKAGKRKAVGRHVSIGVAVVAVVGALAAVPIALTSSGGTLEVAGSSESPTTISMPDPPTRLPSLPLPKPVTPERAAELTVALASSGVIPTDAQVSRVSGEPDDSLRIRDLAGMGYKLYNRVTTSRGSGGLMIWLDTDQNKHRSCDPRTAWPRCEERQVNGRHVVLEEMEGMMGGLRTVHAWLPDGSVVSVQSSGLVPGQVEIGTSPFDLEELVNIATQPWLTF